jgi:hypothetical protein
MKYEKYISLIQTLEVSAAKRPGSYRFKVLMLIGLGYAYFVALILSAIFPIGLIVGVIAIAPHQIMTLGLVLGKLLWVLIPLLGVYFGFIGSAIKAITSKVPNPEGKEITRDDAPELFEFVDRTCGSLKAKRPSRVLITDDFNASVVSMPRIGIFGHKVFLLLGLPLMKSLSSEQFQAVLAHEIGHISGKHGKFAKWTYQMREAWGRLIDSQAENEHKFAALYQGFVNWFFPYFTAYAFVLMREHEKHADREAVGLVGQRQLGEALISMETKGAAQSEFWAGVHKENIASEEPAKQLFTRMLGAMAFTDPEKAKSSLAKAVEAPTDFNDSHPALADRLRLIGYWTHGDLPTVPERHEADAATTFLKRGSETYEREFDNAWDEKAGEGWKERFEYFQKSNTRLEELNAKRSSREATIEEMRELAQLITERDGVESAIPVVKETVERFPEDGVAHYNVAIAKLSQNDDEGLVDLERAVELDKTLKFDADNMAFEYLRAKGRLDEAKRYAGSIDAQAEEFEKAKRERGKPLPGANWLEHDLPEEFIASLPKKLAGMDEIDAVYVAHKEVKYFPEQPYRVLFLALRKKGRLRNRHDADPATILKVVSERLDNGQFHYFIVLAAEWAGTKYYLDRIPGARVYSRPE